MENMIAMEKQLEGQSAQAPAAQLIGPDNHPRTCMSCCRRPATRMVFNSKGRKQFRCEVCYARKNESGFASASNRAKKLEAK